MLRVSIGCRLLLLINWCPGDYGAIWLTNEISIIGEWRRERGFIICSLVERNLPINEHPARIESFLMYSRTTPFYFRSIRFPRVFRIYVQCKRSCTRDLSYKCLRLKCNLRHALLCWNSKLLLRWSCYMYVVCRESIIILLLLTQSQPVGQALSSSAFGRQKLLCSEIQSSHHRRAAPSTATDRMVNPN